MFIWFPNPIAPRSELDQISQLPMIIYHGAPRSLQNFTVTIVTITLNMAISFAAYSLGYQNIFFLTFEF